VTNTLYSIIRVFYDVQLALGVTTSELIWYHTCLELVYAHCMFRMSHNCLWVWCELRVWCCCVLANYFV